MNATEKRLTKKDALLSLMSDGRWHHIRELNRLTYRYGARFWEMRKQGHEIEKRSVGTDEFEYRLLPVRDGSQQAFGI